VPLPSRGAPTGDLLRVLSTEYGLVWHGHTVDLGGSNNLNLHLRDGRGRGHVARLYCGWTSAARLADIQRVRLQLRAAGLPFEETVATRDGAGWVSVGGRVLEVARYVEGARMAIGEPLRRGVGVLARIHGVLRRVTAGEAARTAPHPNHVGAARALDWTRGGTAGLRTPAASSTDLLVADLADELAAGLRDAELELVPGLAPQLVHGDFWDNNVLFREGEIVLVLDLDFMGWRPRIDDLALTLYYTTSTLGDGYTSQARVDVLRRLVDAYDGGLDDHLTAVERRALPLALARTVLCFVGMLASIEDAQARRKLVAELAPDLRWSIEVARHADRWQAAFA
jgi:Ser/Thr protein kinase RdoA (MazF antagonist)